MKRKASEMIALSVFAIGPSLIAGFIGYPVYLLFDLIAPQSGIITAITAIALLASAAAFCTSYAKRLSMRENANASSAV